MAYSKFVVQRLDSLLEDLQSLAADLVVARLEHKDALQAGSATPTDCQSLPHRRSSDGRTYKSGFMTSSNMWWPRQQGCQTALTAAEGNE